jgi:hypothetical protein
MPKFPCGCLDSCIKIDQLFGNELSDLKRISISLIILHKVVLPLLLTPDSQTKGRMKHWHSCPHSINR